MKHKVLGEITFMYPCIGMYPSNGWEWGNVVFEIVVASEKDHEAGPVALDKSLI